MNSDHLFASTHTFEFVVSGVSRAVVVALPTVTLLICLSLWGHFGQVFFFFCNLAVQPIRLLL